jgi:hypothetical protein
MQTNDQKICIKKLLRKSVQNLNPMLGFKNALTDLIVNG